MYLFSKAKMACLLARLRAQPLATFKLVQVGYERCFPARRAAYIACQPGLFSRAVESRRFNRQGRVLGCELGCCDFVRLIEGLSSACNATTGIIVFKLKICVDLLMEF